MSWARYDDELPSNRKVAWLRAHGQAGIAALGLHLLANTWSRHEGMQGFIPDYMPEQLVGKPWRTLVALLADDGCGMFEVVDNGWMINDYDEYGGNPKHRRKIPTEIRIHVYSRDDFRCVSCGSTSDLTLDHIMPWSRGGLDTERNLQTLCRSCNSVKGAKV